jgi:hypothetical protein
LLHATSSVELTRGEFQGDPQPAVLMLTLHVSSSVQNAIRATIGFAAVPLPAGPSVPSCNSYSHATGMVTAPVSVLTPTTLFVAAGSRIG